MPGWKKCGSGLSGQQGPCDEGIWLEVPVLHSGCHRLGDLKGFGAGKECEAALHFSRDLCQKILLDFECEICPL